ncbi:hypothetical protein [Lysinibacillus sp. S2017]|uniref:hypothetical protein n=1 Tax=Lysinibacillus sp. S2017 TaxID=2561923 RepID=UPI0010923B8F|nr:hypothetical protein [Lysinibacillus sp. S2017]TGN30377.1 hypothetical protein E4L99_17640 [Lysinibacillus sp. S2017]
MSLNLGMTMKEFIEMVQNEKLSNHQVKALLDEAGEVISKNAITDIYVAGGYVLKDVRKRIFEPGDPAQEEMTLETAITLARSMRSKKVSVAKPEKKKAPLAYVVNDEPIVESVAPVPVEQFVGRIYSNPLSIERPEEAREFILASLGLTTNELESIKELIHSGLATAFNESIYEAVKQLGSRERKNKTYYISTEIIERVAAFTESKNVRVSEFIEVALLEAIKKYH